MIKIIVCFPNNKTTDSELRLDHIPRADVNAKQLRANITASGMMEGLVLKKDSLLPVDDLDLVSDQYSVHLEYH
jgi:hypothetical protein